MLPISQIQVPVVQWKSSSEISPTMVFNVATAKQLYHPCTLVDYFVDQTFSTILVCSAFGPLIQGPFGDPLRTCPNSQVSSVWILEDRQVSGSFSCYDYKNKCSSGCYPLVLKFQCLPTLYLDKKLHPVIKVWLEHTRPLYY